MKKPIHLYIFTGLSTIATLQRLFAAFFTDPSAAQVLAQQQAAAGVATEAELLAMYEQLFSFQVGIAQKIFNILLLVALATTVVFLFQKKNELASYTYIGYLFGTLALSTYNFVATKGLYAQFEDEMMRTILTGTATGTYIFAVVLFAIYFGLTVFFLLRKPKETPSVATNATDI